MKRLKKSHRADLAISRFILRPLPEDLSEIVRWNPDTGSLTRKEVIARLRHRWSNYDQLRRDCHLDGKPYSLFKRFVNGRIEVALAAWEQERAAQRCMVQPEQPSATLEPALSRTHHP